MSDDDRAETWPLDDIEAGHVRPVRRAPRAKVDRPMRGRGVGSGPDQRGKGQTRRPLSALALALDSLLDDEPRKGRELRAQLVGRSPTAGQITATLHSLQAHGRAIKLPGGRWVRS